MSNRQPDTQSPVRDISDTALWAAVYRAMETERPDALFDDFLARRLAGARGVDIADALPDATRHSWVIAVRTCLIDRFILKAIAQGADLVVNLAAGLDTRPYRLTLPRRLTWIEVDVPQIISYKEESLRDETPVCGLERVGLNLLDETARRDLFHELGRRAAKVAVVTEGLLIYCTPADATTLALDLARPASFRTWIFDLHLPGLVRLLRQAMGSVLESAGAPLQLSPATGPEFFVPCGWPATSALSILTTAAQLRRLPQEFGGVSLPDAGGLEQIGNGEVPERPSPLRRRIDGLVCSSSRA